MKTVFLKHVDTILKRFAIRRVYYSPLCKKGWVVLMRIIRRGTDSKDVILTGTCLTCKTEVEFTRGEAECHSDQREGTSYFVKCPVCNGRIYHYPNASYWRDR